MQQIAVILLNVLGVFRLILLARIILEWVRESNPKFRPKGIFLILAELTFTLTDWAIKPLSKIIKPVRVGGAYIDLSVLALFVILIVLETLLRTLI